jgi:hypothetical protein
MWWKKKTTEKPLVNHREELNSMASALLKASGVDFDHGTTLVQALIGTFLFGMIQTHGMSHKLTPPEIHALALIVFKESLHYSDSAAAQGVQECINAASPGYHDTMNAILHRGIDGHRQYANRDCDGLRTNIISVLDQFRKKAG